MTNSKIWCESGTSPPQNNDLQKTSKFITVHDKTISTEFLDELLKSLISVIMETHQLFNKRIWTIDDVMKATGLAKQSIYNKASKDEIPHRKRAGKLYFLLEEIIDWIDEGELK